MIRTVGLFTSMALLMACSGDGRGSQYSSARAQGSSVSYVPITPVTQTAVVRVPEVKFSTGPIYEACLGAGRNGATQSRCGCVQWVADRQLSPAQQRQGAGYFTSQNDLQEIRQSDSRRNEEFWSVWQAFGSSAGQICRGT